jgi:hypothetical protein
MVSDYLFYKVTKNYLQLKTVNRYLLTIAKISAKASSRICTVIICNFKKLLVTDIWVSKFITDIEYRELKDSFHIVWLASPWRHEINEEDALSTMIGENPYYTLLQFQAASQKYLNK